jgi:RNAse (barnase) inhibitor barstar
MNETNETRTSIEVFTLFDEKMKTRKEALAHIAEVFKFPDYFGHNLDALDECITDLEWINADNYVILLFGQIEEPIREIIRGILIEAVKYWESKMVIIELEGSSHTVNWIRH